MDIGGWSNVVVGIFSGQIGCRLRSRKDCVEGQLGRGALLSDSSVQVVAQTEWLTFDYWQSRASKCKVGCCVSAVSESSRCCSGGVGGGHFFTVAPCTVARQRATPEYNFFTSIFLNSAHCSSIVSRSTFWKPSCSHLSLRKAAEPPLSTMETWEGLKCESSAHMEIFLSTRKTARLLLCLRLPLLSLACLH